MMITIARQCGCQGDAVAKKLAEHFQIPCYDKKHLREMAKESGMAQRYPGFFEEQETNSFLAAIAADLPSNLAQNTARKALQTTLGNQSAVVIGRCGNYVYRNESGKMEGTDSEAGLSEKETVVSIFLCGTKAYRIQNIMDAHDMPYQKAKQLVEETDERRASYHQYYTGQIWGFAGNYNLCIDESRLDLDGVISIICDYIEQTMGKEKLK